jgi:hypothetical protein
MTTMVATTVPTAGTPSWTKYAAQVANAARFL